MDVKSLVENLLFTTVRIDTESEDGTRGAGTGFIFQQKFRDQFYPFIVTNKHVVGDSKTGGITFILGDADGPKLGDAYRVQVADFDKIWHGHPEENVDIAVAPLVPLLDPLKGEGVAAFFRHISNENIPTVEQEKELDAFEEIIFVGYPNGIWDRKNFTPIIRRGTTATPFALDYEGEKKFLIDASVFSGSSGSPVFIYESGIYAQKDGGSVVGTKFYFIGVVASVYYKTDASEIVSMPVPTQLKFVAVDKEMIDLGIVFKAETVVAAIEAALVKIGV